MVICLERGADLHMAQLMPLPPTVSCSSKIQIGFTFLVPAHPGSPGQKAIKRVCVVCVMQLVVSSKLDCRHQVSVCVLMIANDVTRIVFVNTLSFNGPLSGTTRVSQYQRGQTNLDFTETRDSEWQITMPGPHHSFFYRLHALPAAQPTASKH